MPLYIFQKGFNYSQDGPGNRLVYHLSGCNMRCPWCSNPEGMKFHGKTGAAADIKELIDEAVSCRPMFFNGGGVTLTGGEVCMQAEAAKEFLTGLRERDIHTAVETNASLPGFETLLPYVSYLMADLKHYDGDKLKRVTGVGVEQVITNFSKAVNYGKMLHVRIPLINGFNARESDADGFIRFLSEYDLRSFDVEFLCYHEYGKEKWKSLGLKYEVTNGFVPQDVLRKFAKSFTDAGISVVSS